MNFHPIDLIMFSFKVRCPKAEDEDGNFALEILYGLSTRDWNLCGLTAYQNLTSNDHQNEGKIPHNIVMHSVFQ